MFNTNTFGRNQRRRRGSNAARLGIIGAMVIVLVIGIGLSIHLSSRPGNAKTVSVQPRVIEPGMVEVVVPLQSIPPGATLEPNMFHRVNKPEVVVGKDIIRDFEEIKGLYSRGVLVAEQTVHRDFLTTLQPVNALTASIPHGYRAIAIAVDATSSVEGWAQPGARVDVIWVTRDFGTPMAYVIAPNAKVLSANKKAEGARVEGKGAEAEMPSTVTLLLSVRDSMRVRLAALNGRLALVLRGVNADNIKPAAPISERSLFNIAPKPAAETIRNIVDVKVRDRRTGAVEVLQFEDGQRISQ